MMCFCFLACFGLGLLAFAFGFLPWAWLLKASFGLFALALPLLLAWLALGFCLLARALGVGSAFALGFALAWAFCLFGLLCLSALAWLCLGLLKTSFGLLLGSWLCFFAFALF